MAYRQAGDYRMALDQLLDAVEDFGDTGKIYLQDVGRQIERLRESAGAARVAQQHDVARGHALRNCQPAVGRPVK